MASNVVAHLDVKDNIYPRKERAENKIDGIVGLDLLQNIGVACCAYAHESARIGEAADGLANGVLTHCNARAAQLGLSPGLTVGQALRLIDVAFR
jgi:hypothetical protein